MAEWQQFFQSIVVGLLFSYLLAKLISVVVSFKDDDILSSISLNSSDPNRTQPPRPPAAANLSRPRDFTSEDPGNGGGGGLHDTDPSSPSTAALGMRARLAATPRTTTIGGASRAPNWTRCSVPPRRSLRRLLVLIAFRRSQCRATCSDNFTACTRSPPKSLAPLLLLPPSKSPPAPSGKPGRNWVPCLQKMRCISTLTLLWSCIRLGLSGLALKSKGGDGEAQSSDATAPMGPVFSTFVYEEESGNELKMDVIHAFAREGEMHKLLKCIDNGVSVNWKDSGRRTPLHWAVDRGHRKVAEVLVGRKSDINAQDNEGQTPLPYAVVCERKDIAEFLVQQNADTDVKDNDGKSPYDLCELDWPWMQRSATHRVNVHFVGCS